MSVSGVTTTRTSPMTARGIHTDTRAIHRPRLAWLNAGWICVVMALLLSVLGIIAISTTAETSATDYALRQAIHLAVGLLVAGMCILPHFRWLQVISYPAMVVVLLLLVFVLIPWVPESIVRPRNGARRWISLVVTDIQPSELAKIAYVLTLASYLRYRENHRRIFGLLQPLLLTFIPMGLVLVEPDLGTALLFLPTFFAMLIGAGAKLWHLVLIIALGLSMAPAMYPLLKPHQKDRIMAMVAQMQGDDRLENDEGYQGARAMTLVGAGQLTGVGREKARDLIVYNHLPEEHNDMIFAVVACRWGMLGAIFMWGLFLALCAGGLLVASSTRDPFGRLVAVGLTALLFAQVTVNCGMTIGLLPITGMTLPFVSYGGSSMVTTWISIGILFNIALRRSMYLFRQSFEFDTEGVEE